MEFSLAIFIPLPLPFLLCQSWCNPPLIARCCLSCTGRASNPPPLPFPSRAFCTKSCSALPCWCCPSLGAPGTLPLSVLSQLLLPGGNEPWGMPCASITVPSVSPELMQPLAWVHWGLDTGMGVTNPLLWLIPLPCHLCKTKVNAVIFYCKLGTCVNIF